MKSTIKRLIAIIVSVAVILIGLAVIGVLSRNADDTRESQDQTSQTDSDYQQPVSSSVAVYNDQTESPSIPEAPSSSSIIEDTPSIPDQNDDTTTQ